MDERAYDALRLRQWVAGRARGFSRRDLLKLGALGALVPALPAAAAASPIVKPLPPELFRVYGTNAETR